MTKLDQVIALLTEIRDLLRPMDTPDEAEDDSEGQCRHLAGHRVPFGRSGWICRRCRFHGEE